MRRSHKPVVRDNRLLNTDGNPHAASPVLVGTPPWHEWLADNPSFVFEGGSGHLTARRQTRRGVAYWYAYRRRGGKLFTAYLGKPQELTPARLEWASAYLAGQAPPTQPSSQASSAGRTGALRNGPHSQANEAVPSCFPMTQVMPPALPHKLIPRPRLTQYLNAPVTVVCAPSGFGKSTVLNEWRQSCGLRVAWVTLDTEDNHPLRFWSKVVTALQMVDPVLGQGWVSQLRDSPASALSDVVVNLTNDILRMVHEPSTAQAIGLVLDNYHHIQNTEIHTSLQTWLEHIPQTLRLAVASITRPPLALGYLRAQGMVAELGVDDLRFTPEEGIEFLLQHTPGQRLADSDMATLVKRSEGWVTALVLATCALAQQGDCSRFVETFTGAHRFIREFFAESVLHQQPPRVRTFLVKTSILKQLSGPLCDAVTGQSGSAEMLARLWEERLFVERLTEPDGYRYHGLFAEMLRTLLQEQFPAEIPRLHRNAAKWYRAQDRPADAIHHCLLGESWEEAATLMESFALGELEQLGEDSRLLRWLQQLPEAVLRQHRTLLMVYLRLVRLGLPPKEVEDFLSRTEMSIASMPAAEKTSAWQETLAEIQRIRHSLASDGQAILGLGARREQDTVGQTLDGILNCHRDRRVDLVQAEAQANAVYETARATNQLFSILLAGGECANLAFSQGHLRRSEQLAHQLLRQANESRDKLPEPASTALAALSGVYFEQNQVDKAQQLLERAIEVNPDPIISDESMKMAILRAKIQSTKGDSDAALATIEAARELYSHHPSSIWLDQDLRAYQALFLLHQGDPTASEGPLGDGWEIDQHPFSAFVRASILMEQSRNVAAEEVLRHLFNRYPHGFYWVPILRVQVKLAICLFNQRKVSQARQTMAKAVRIAAPEFFARPFSSSEAPIPALLSLVLHTEDLGPGTKCFVRGALTMLGHADDIQEASSQQELMPLAIAASISPREQEVLRLLSAGLSNREIAARFLISASTVKTHLENIYLKLGVNSRTQAVAQAHALKLL